MNNITWLLGALLIVSISSSCKKNSAEEPELLGARICASSQFQYTTPFKVNGSTSSTAVDFTANPGYVVITALLSEKVSWKITITGQTSGAVKTYTGTTNNVNVKWYGNADGDVFFQDGEVCQIALAPSCKNEVTIDVTIAHKSTFRQMGVLAFDEDNVFASSYGDTNNGKINEDTLHADASPQGGKCHILYAPQGASGWYYGSCAQPNGIASAMAYYADGLSSDEVYLNVYMKADPNTSVTLSVIEEVNGENYTYKLNVNVNWTGWKMVSYKMSDLHIGDPSKIKEVGFTPAPKVYNAQSEAYADFMIITKGKPFAGTN